MKFGHGQCDRTRVDDVSESVTLGVETLAPLGAQDQTIVKLVCGTAPRRERRHGKHEGRPGAAGGGRAPEMGWESPGVGARTTEAGIESPEVVSLTNCNVKQWKFFPIHCSPISENSIAFRKVVELRPFLFLVRPMCR